MLTRIGLIVVVVAAIFLAPARASIPVPTNLCQTPPFIDQNVSHKPQILILLDNSGSMANPAYTKAWQPTRDYYGYFDVDKCYTYTGVRWRVVGLANADNSCAGGNWSGAFLNWVTMRRMDIARQVLVGGLGAPRVGSGSTPTQLRGEPSPSGCCGAGFQRPADARNYSPFRGPKLFALSPQTNQFVVPTNVGLVEAGGSHTCALDVNSNVRCWGANAVGQLGDGTYTQRLTPVIISTLLPGEVTSLTAGDLFTCALLFNGTVKCWGDNAYGQLGIGIVGGNTNTPVLVPGLTNVVALNAGAQHVCALLQNGRLRCWGNNASGQLGDGTTTPRSSPTDVLNLTKVVDVAGGLNHTCALAETAQLYGVPRYDAFCWGDNTYGQLGIGVSGVATSQLLPTLVPSTRLKGAQRIVAGYEHTCVQTGYGAAADVYCWGRNNNGQLGIGSTINKNTPTLLTSSSLGNLIAITAGNYHTCALRNPYYALCWGLNTSGQVGDNSVTSKTTPAYIRNSSNSILTHAIWVSGGGLHTCAIFYSGSLQCWGENGSGQVGDNTTVDKKNPTSVSGFAAGGNTYNIQIEKGAPLKGILDNLYLQARLGLEIFDYAGDGGDIDVPIGTSGANLSTLQTRIENIVPNQATPLARSLINAVRYLRWDPPPPWASGAYTMGGGVNGDPWTDPCSSSYVLVISDGEPTTDTSGLSTGTNPVLTLYNYAANSSPAWNFAGAQKVIGDHNYPGLGIEAFDDYFDDVALWASHPRNILSGWDNPKSGTRGHRYNRGIPVYMVFTFGDPTFIPYHNLVGRNGVFKDGAGVLTNFPDATAEWDQDGDGRSDGFYYAEDGNDVERAVNDAFADILQRTAAGTSISVVATSRRGEGSIIQSYFRPILAQATRELSWLGMLQSLWIDEVGNTREDTVMDQKLDKQADKIVRFRYDANLKETLADRFVDANGDNMPDSSVPAAGDANLSLMQLVPVWEAGAELAVTGPSNRFIYTFLDNVTPNQISESGEVVPFTPSTVPYDLFLHPDHLSDGQGIPVTYATQTTWLTAIEWLIRFVRGEDAATNSGLSGFFRSRRFDTLQYRGTVLNNVEWPLGDIVYSTPIIVGAPAERYDLIYNDRTYAPFYVQYSRRKPIVYVGANDGMLHAFNAGRFDTGSLRFLVETINGRAGRLGAEVAAFVPSKVLPMLQYYASQHYDSECHLSFVDQTPRITDAKIFADDAVHPNGWGTILLAGMRLGCHDARFSSILVVDATDPDFMVQQLESGNGHSVILAELSHVDLDLTYSFPAVARVGPLRDPLGNILADERWFLVVGSGPDNLQNVTASGQAKLLVYDLGALVRDKRAPSTTSIPPSMWVLPISAGGVPESPAFTSGILAVDANLDYSIEAFYFGTTVDQIPATPARYGGGLWRLLTGDNPNPATWKISRVINGDEVLAGTNQGRMFNEMPTALLDPDAMASGRLVPWIVAVSGRYLSRTGSYDDFYYPCQSPASSCTRPYQVAVGLRDECLPGNQGTYDVNCNAQYTLASSGKLVNVTRAVVEPSGTLSGITGFSTFQSLKDTLASSATKRGWVIELGNYAVVQDNHERGSGRPVFDEATRMVILTTFSPTAMTTSACASSGLSAAHLVYFGTGTANPQNPITTATSRNDSSTALGDVYKNIEGMLTPPSLHENTIILQDARAGVVVKSKGSGVPFDTGLILWRNEY